MYRLAFAFSLLLALLSVTMLPASAGFITYNSPSAWDAAVSAPSTLTFDGTQITAFGLNYTEGGVDFALNGHTYDSALAILPANFLNAGPFYGSSYFAFYCYIESAEAPCPSPNILTVTLPIPVQAIAFDYAELRGHIMDYSIAVDGEDFSAATAFGSRFFGITGTDPFTTFTITAKSGIASFDWATIDNLSYSTVLSKIPEPLTASFFGCALLGLLAVRRRKSKEFT